MKKTKVYVDDKLLIYDDFSLCCTKNFDNTFYTNNYSLIDNEEYFEAYFQSIKSHDRELVRQVCEKIRKEIESQTDVRIAVNNFNTITGHGLEYVFRKIQKEFEK